MSSLSQLRHFSSNVSPAPRIKEAVENFLNVRKSELQQYEAVDPSDKEETEKLIKVLEGAQISPESTWASLGLDGLDEVELVLSIEESLGITLPDEEFHKVRSVSDAINMFSKYTAKQG